MLQNKPPKIREQRLFALLPAAIALLAYSFIFAIPAQRQCRRHLAELEAVRHRAVDQLEAASAKDNLELAKTGLRRLREQLASDRYKIKELARIWRNQESQLETVREITEKLQSFDLSIVSQDYVNDPTLSTYMKDLVKKMDGYSPDAPLEYWQIDLEGRYVDIRAFLAAIDLERMKTFPISLSLEASDSNNGIHHWTILFLV